MSIESKHEYKYEVGDETMHTLRDSQTALPQNGGENR